MIAGDPGFKDMAEMFIRAARAEPSGAVVCNVRNSVVEVSDVLDTLTDIAGPHRVTCETDAPLGVPSDLDDAALFEAALAELDEVVHRTARSPDRLQNRSAKIGQLAHLGYPTFIR